MLVEGTGAVAAVSSDGGPLTSLIAESGVGRWGGNAKSIAEARELGVAQDLIDFEGLSPQMLVALGKDDVKSLEDFATCADWELAGGYTTVDGERHKDDGVLESFEVNIQEAQDMIMRARLQIGWVTEEQLAEDAAAAEAANADTNSEGAET